MPVEVLMLSLAVVLVGFVISTGACLALAGTIPLMLAKSGNLKLARDLASSNSKALAKISPGTPMMIEAFVALAQIERELKNYEAADQAARRAIEGCEARRRVIEELNSKVAAHSKDTTSQLSNEVMVRQFILEAHAELEFGWSQFWLENYDEADLAGTKCMENLHKAVDITPESETGSKPALNYKQLAEAHELLALSASRQCDLIASAKYFAAGLEIAETHNLESIDPQLFGRLKVGMNLAESADRDSLS